MNTILRILLACVLISAFNARASAHEAWADGKPIPEWVKNLCCNGNEAHMFDESDVSQDAQGRYHLRGYVNSPQPDHVFASMDGHVWAFIAVFGAPASSIWCLFLPENM